MRTRRSDGGSECLMDGCRQERLAALRRLIEDAEAGGISEGSVEEVFADAPASSDERGRQAGSAVKGRSDARAPRC